MRYKADITAGSLKVPESRVIADLLLRGVNGREWDAAILDQNVLQARTLDTAKRLARLIRGRLSLMDADLWRLVRDGSGDVATHASLAATVENARTIIDAVRPKRAKFCFEMMGWALPDSADSYLQLVKAIDRDAFGVHLDPCNVINSPERFYRNTELLNECFDKLGPWIVSCHAKDLAWDVEMNVHFREVTLGMGKLDYTTYLKRLATLPGDVSLMIEHMQGPEEYDKSRQYLFDLGEKIGVSLS